MYSFSSAPGAVAGGRDVDGDGAPDFSIGAKLYSGATGTLLFTAQGAGVGSASSFLGDVDGDGRSEWVVSRSGFVDVYRSPRLTVTQTACNLPALVQLNDANLPNGGYLLAFGISTAGAPSGWLFGIDVTFSTLAAITAPGSPFIGMLDA